MPSRASLFTGTSPWCHGVDQTDGMAKHADDPALHWLPPDRMPTLGHRVQAAGGDAVYFGKWHLSDPGAGTLEPWGFTGWTGPEPHGADPSNSGTERDPAFVEQACAWLRDRGTVASDRPFLLVVSLVNPHDIVFWPAWSLWAPGRLDLRGIPKMGAGPTDAVRPEEEPSAISAYRQRYRQAYAPAPVTEALYALMPDRYRRFYASLLRRTDVQLGAVLSALAASGLAGTTDVIFTSDHGELLGAHGGLHQKFYNAFEETLRVPCWLRRADGAGAGTVCAHPTTHLDLVPTVLASLGLPPTASLPGFSFEPQLQGRDLACLDEDRPAYFVTQDDIFGGASPEALVCRSLPWLGAMVPLRYPPLGVRNRAVEAVVVSRRDAKGERRTWKVLRYFDPEAPAAHPDDEWSLFDLTTDPCEARDRVSDPAARAVLQSLQEQLAAARGSVGGPQAGRVPG